MRNTIKKGFTLIELLVVITIIWILATSWVAIYSTNIQWARDVTRISDMKLLEWALTQVYSDDTDYPLQAAFTTSIEPFLSKELEDPKKWKSICSIATAANDQDCEWRYTEFTWNQSYKLSVLFEKEKNVSIKATKDWWTDAASISYYEVFGWNDWAAIPPNGWAVIY